MNAILNLLANEPTVAKGGAMMGTLVLIGAIVNLSLAGVYLIWRLIWPTPGIRTEQCLATLIVASSVASFVILLFGWDFCPPKFPLVMLASVLGHSVGAGSALVLFPLVSTYYGGWLVAPIRAGTDLSSMITAFVSLAQNPTGDSNRFPTWVVFLIYALLSACGLAAWVLILRRGIGLRVLEEGRPDTSDSEENEDSAGSDSAGNDAAASEEKSTRKKRCFCAQFESLACPPFLRLPVALAAATQVTQWCLAMSFGEIGAMMSDPSSCDGSRGQFVWRMALTASQVLVPCCSLLSSVRRCPQWLLVVLSILQYFSSLLVLFAAFGIGRSFWTSQAGQFVFISAFAACGGLEGYIITMAYRYIGDAEAISEKLRHSASSLLSLLTVLPVSLLGLWTGAVVADGSFACVEPPH
ncbi:unnamed protein product [Polarella glacialis]|uniref:Uncharacterized protein n=1 Tax=Polarella glacialis TaxID=89957 RepID=A0A813DS07_POLGL|nr:unnamed protein product [Polarella glacialis]CAE8631600.1 unnamed protein product [Polarella glacialis]